jgi:hypothetical protein
MLTTKAGLVKVVTESNRATIFVGWGGRVESSKKDVTEIYQLKLAQVKIT